MRLFLTSKASAVLDKIMPLLPKPTKELKVAFIRTAANPYPEKPWADDDRNRLVELGFQIIDFDIAGKDKKEIRDVLSKVDIIFVAGGNTFYLLKKARESGFDEVAKKLIAEGKIYIGSSAGSIIVGPNIEPVKYFDDPNVAQSKSSQGFNLVDFVVLPHYGREKYELLHKMVITEFGKKYKLVTLTDEQFVLADGKNNQILTI